MVINVNNTLTDSDIPTTSTDWMNYGGITRDVDLVNAGRGRRKSDLGEDYQAMVYKKTD